MLTYHFAFRLPTSNQKASSGRRKMPMKPKGIVCRRKTPKSNQKAFSGMLYYNILYYTALYYTRHYLKRSGRRRRRRKNFPEASKPRPPGIHRQHILQGHIPQPSQKASSGRWKMPKSNQEASSGRRKMPKSNHYTGVDPKT